MLFVHASFFHSGHRQRQRKQWANVLSGYSWMVRFICLFILHVGVGVFTCAPACGGQGLTMGVSWYYSFFTLAVSQGVFSLGWVLSNAHPPPHKVPKTNRSSPWGTNDFIGFTYRVRVRGYWRERGLCSEDNSVWAWSLLIGYAGWLTSLWNLPVSSSPALGLQMCDAVLDVWCGCWGSKPRCSHLSCAHWATESFLTKFLA